MNRFLTLATRCPRCKRRPGIRLNDCERDRYTHEQPEHIVLTYHCKCGEVYPVRAKDYQDAA